VTTLFVVATICLAGLGVCDEAAQNSAPAVNGEEIKKLISAEVEKSV
jgi:hypothetical protein